MIENLVYLFSCIGILLVLFFSSKEDIKYHRISKKYVLSIFIIVLIYNNIIGGSVEKTIAFIFTLGIFSGITFFSRGAFGFGDTLIIAALGWFIGDLIQLRYFFIILIFCILIIESYFVVKNRQNGMKIKNVFNSKKLVHINDIKPGMILSNDYFMKGLTEKDINDLKKIHNGTIMIKQAYPFIPVIFLTFMIYVIVIIAI